MTSTNTSMVLYGTTTPYTTFENPFSKTLVRALFSACYAIVCAACLFGKYEDFYNLLSFVVDFYDKPNPFMLLECCNLTSPFSNLGVLDGISIFANFDRTLLLANSEDPNQTAHHAVLICACTVRLSPIQKGRYTHTSKSWLSITYLYGMSNRSRVN